MKYLLVLVVVFVVLWSMFGRSRVSGPPPAPGTGRGRGDAAPPAPQAMVECAHCGLHLPAADAVLEGSRVFCSEAHRALGPRR